MIAAPTSGLSKLELIEEITVTGTQIRGIQNETAQVITWDRAAIAATGYKSANQLMESLVQNVKRSNQSVVAPGGEVSASREQGASVELRGTGPGSTLILLNGRRLAPGFRSSAVDISSLPLSALERVEVLLDGASALYGSDAIGGVVNFIIRDDFEGAETQLSGGSADGSDSYRIGQTLGTAWGSGNALVSVDYSKRDLLLASDRDFVPANSQIGSLLPEDEVTSVIASGNQEINGVLSAFADVWYAQRDSNNQAGRITLAETGETDNSQGHATAGLAWQPGNNWRVEGAGSYGRFDIDVDRRGVNARGLRNDSVVESLFESAALEVKADGSLLDLPGGPLNVALGASFRTDDYEDQTLNGAGAVLSSVDQDQEVVSGFVEAYIPLVGIGNTMPGLRRVEVSLAGRYDDYSNFGGSFDPQFGLMVEPLNGLTLRGRYTTSYKAPNLATYSESGNQAAAISGADPMSPTGMSYQLQVVGNSADTLRAQEAHSTSFGVKFSPAWAPNLSMALDYYAIRYRNRIAAPPQNPLVLINDPQAYGQLLIRDPSVDQVQQFIGFGQRGQGFVAFDPVTFMPTTNFNPADVDLIVDVRTRNLSVRETEGMDLLINNSWLTDVGTFAIGLNATYTLKLEDQITTTSAPVDTVNTYANPPDWRGRLGLSWQNNGWTSSAFVNHTDSYLDNRFVIPRPITSYTTVDARVAYAFDTVGFMSGVTVAAGAQNIADKDPPRTAIINLPSDSGYDYVNGDPLGRYVYLELNKSW